jgi:cysteine desulfurase/selenocysteine lyase
MWILWESIKKEFPIFLEYPDLIYLDNASTTHKPQSVIDAMNSYQKNSYANIHRWVYNLAEQSELLYMESKRKVAKLIWADFREIIYTYNATYASNILAQSLIKTYHIGSW